MGEDCKSHYSVNGDFVLTGIAVDDYAKGEQKTTWIRVKSSRPNHINLAQHLKKGHMLLVQGTLGTSEIYNVERVQLSIIADSIELERNRRSLTS